MAAVEVWLDEGRARGTPQQLLNPDLTLKENFRNKTITEFPVLTVLSKGAGPPHIEPRPVQKEGAGQPHTKQCANIENKVGQDPMVVVKTEDGEKCCVEREVGLDPMVVVKTEGAEECGVEQEVGCAENTEYWLRKEKSGGDSDWSGIEEGEIVENEAQCSASLRMIANMYSDSDNDSN